MEMTGREDSIKDFGMYIPREGENILDFTDEKLKRYALREKDPTQKKLLQDLRDKYINRTIAVCWTNGSLSWLSVK